MTAGDLVATLRKLPQDFEVWLYIEDSCTTIDLVRVDSANDTIDIVGEES